MARVLRLAVGDGVTLFDGRGAEYSAVIARMSKSDVTLRVGEPRRVDRESPLAVTLAQAVSSGERMDYTVQKAVELGVARIQPIVSERCIVRLDAERGHRRVAHWQAVAIAACEQCGRNLVPEVSALVNLVDWLEPGARRETTPLRLLLSPGAPGTLRELARPSGAVTLLAGPEGGLSPREERDAQASGYIPIRLGPRILRTETAALAALAALQTRWGDY